MIMLLRVCVKFWGYRQLKRGEYAMKSKSAFLFPGQGSQVPNMLNTLPPSKIVDDTIQEATDTLNENVYNLHSIDALESTKAVQICLLIHGVAAFRIFQSEGITPDYVAGHSVGAFSAAVSAGVIRFSDALQIVKLRGELMENIHPKGYGMGVVLGMDTNELRLIIKEKHHEEQPVYMANLNAPGQITISGSLKGLKKVLEHSLKNGAQCASMLNVSTPSHCPLLLPVSEALEEALDKISIRPPDIPYAGNQRARLLYDPIDIRKDLSRSVAAPVRWHDATSVLYEKGVRLFIEMPPGSVLTRLANKAFSDVRALSVSESGFDDCYYIVTN